MTEKLHKMDRLTELEHILNIQEMTHKLYDDQNLIEKQVDEKTEEEIKIEQNLESRNDLLDRSFIYKSNSLTNIHLWLNILKLIFILLTILVAYLLIFGNKS